MKNLKKILISLVLVFTMFTCVACSFFGGDGDAVSITSIQKTQSVGLVDTYTITYSDGSTFNFTVTNGKDGVDGEDGQDITIADVYNYALAQGYVGDYWEFLDSYLSFNLNSSSVAVAANKAVLSAVSVYSEFPTNVLPNKLTVGTGGGVIYKLDKDTGDAYIITNYHVVYNTSSTAEDGLARKYYIYLYGYEESVYYITDALGNKILDGDDRATVNYGENAIECEYVGGSIAYDIAILKVSNSQILKDSSAKQVEIADGFNVGEVAIAIGNPDGDGISITQGVVSRDSEYINLAIDNTARSYRSLRIDTAVNSGNSGGGLYNDSGKLIGIVNAKTSDSTLENFGYAIPLNIATGVADNVIYNYEENSQKQVKRLTLGLTITAKNSRSVLNLETYMVSIEEDVIVEVVNDDSLAQSLGFEVDDKINNLTINGTKYTFKRYFEISELLLKVKPGDNLVFNITRGNVSENLTAYTAVDGNFVIIA